MFIRQAAQPDHAALYTLLTQLGYPPVTYDFVLEKMESYATPGYQLLVCEVEGEIAGFISFHWFYICHSEKKMGRITALCVSDHMRSQRVGALLLEEAEKRLILEGCYQIEVTTNLSRKRTPGFYLKNGYSEDSRRFVKELSKEVH